MTLRKPKAKAKAKAGEGEGDGGISLSERLVLFLATVMAIVLAYLYGKHTVEVPTIHDAEGYRLIAQDIQSLGVFSKYYLSELRTYGFPAFLSLVWQLGKAVGWTERVAVWVVQVALHFGAAALLWWALRRAGVRSWASVAAYAAVVAHPFALLYPGYYLTESLSLSLGTILLAGGIAAWAGRLPGWLWAVNGLVCGAMVMVRPANLFMVPLWLLVVGWALRKRQWVAVLGLVCIVIPWWPQYRNNRLYHGEATPFVATRLVPLQQKMGVFFLKYATSIVPGGDARVKYENPFLVDVEAATADPLGWYCRHPIAGLKTWAVHVFALFDQDLPLPYVEDLAPWYSPYVAGANWGVVALGLLTMGGAWRRRSELTAGEIGAVILSGLLIVGHLGLHSLMLVEGRYGVALLVPLYGFGAVGLVGLWRRSAGREWLAVGAMLLLVSGTGAAGSIWLQRQAPAIQSAMVAQNPGLAGVAERLTGRRAIDRLCHSPWSTWAMSMAGIGPDGEGILVSDGTQVSVMEHEVVVDPERKGTVTFEVRGEAGSTEALRVDFAGQSEEFSNHTGGYQPVTFNWKTGPQPPGGVRLRFSSMARRPLRIQKVQFSGVSERWTGWNIGSTVTGFDQTPVLCSGGTGGISILSRPVTLVKNTAYLVRFEVRGPAGKERRTMGHEQLLSIDLYGGAQYDHREQNALVENFSGEFEQKKFRWNSGSDAPEQAELRFVTMSQKPIQVRNVVFQTRGD